MRTKILALCASALVGISAAQAQVAYSNGPIDGTYGGYTLGSGQTLSNSFTLSSATTITGFTFGGWTDGGATITSVSYGFSSALDYATPDTASLTAGAVVPGSGDGGIFDVRDYSASITPLTLAAGTYWFSLTDAVTDQPGSVAWWDINFGASSQAYCCGGIEVVSEAFTITGSSAAPEPASWALMVGGFGGIGGALRSRHRAAIGVA